MKKRSTRRLLFWAFIALFFVSAPLTVLYTSGYRIGKGGIVRTGTLFVATTPRDVPVTLNDEPWKDSTPTIIKTLLPDRYLLSIDAPGYLPWSKHLEVKSGETTFVDQIQLFLDADPELYLGENVHNAVWSPDGNWVAWADHQLGWSEIWISSLDRPASRLISRVERDDNVLIAWHDNERVRVSSNERDTWFSTVGTIIDEPEATSESTTLDISGGTTTILKGTSRVATLERTSWTIKETRGSYVLLFDPQNKQIALVNTADQDEPLLLLEDAIDAAWSRSGILAFHSAFALSTYNPGQHQTTLITRISDPIVDVAWHPNDGYLLYATQTNIFVIERDVRDGRNVLNLGTFNSVEGLNVDDTGRELYVVAERGFDRGVFRRTLWERPGICLPRTGCF